jgi:hypothetical protein
MIALTGIVFSLAFVMVQLSGKSSRAPVSEKPSASFCLQLRLDKPHGREIIMLRFQPGR